MTMPGGMAPRIQIATASSKGSQKDRASSKGAQKDSASSKDALKGTLYF
jgi:hypothetical protein